MFSILNHQGNQNKTTLRFYITPVRMAKIENSGDSRWWWGCGERATLLHCWWDCKLVQPLWKSVSQFLRKLDIVLPGDPTIQFWAYIQKLFQLVRHILHYVHSSLIYSSQKLERTQMPLNTGIDTKMWYMYRMDYCSATKRNGFMKFLGKWRYLEDIILSEVTQSQKKSLDMHSLISGY